MKPRNVLAALFLFALVAVPVSAAPPTQGGGQEYVVQEGDWLSKIADKYYGDKMAYPTIVEATNAKAKEDSSFATITDPYLIGVGQKLWIPDVPSKNGSRTVEAVAAVVKQIYSEYAASLRAADLDRWISLWTDDGVQMGPGRPTRTGKQAIRTGVKNALDRFAYDMEIPPSDEVRVAGDWAFARGNYSVTLTPRQGGDVVIVDGKYLTIFQRQADGSWKIHRDIFNSNVSP